MTTAKLTKAQSEMLGRIIDAGPDGLVVPGTHGATARVLRGLGLVEFIAARAKACSAPAY